MAPTLPRVQPPLPRSDPLPPPTSNINNIKNQNETPNDSIGKRFEPVIDNKEVTARPVGNQSSGPSNSIEKNVQGPSKPAADPSLEDWNCQKCETANFYFRQMCKCCGAKKVEAALNLKPKPTEPVSKVSQPQNAQPNIVS